MDETRLTARLPALDVEMVRRRPTDGSETVTIHLRATPGFEAAARLLAPQAMMAMPLLAMNPFLAAWGRAVGAMWAPWLLMLPKGDDRDSPRAP